MIISLGIVINSFIPNGIFTIINWISPFSFKGLFGGIFHFYSDLNRHYVSKHWRPCLDAGIAASDLGLHCLSMSHKKDDK